MMTNKKAVTELFEHHYEGLVSSLPLHDDNFLDNLSSYGLISEHFKHKLKSFTKCKEKASYFLDNKIKPDDDSTNFMKLLTVMKDCDYDNCKELAEQIKGECIVAEKCKFYVYTYVQYAHLWLYTYIICTYIPYKWIYW